MVYSRCLDFARTFDKQTADKLLLKTIAGWSSLVARRAHNPKVRGSNPLPATSKIKGLQRCKPFFIDGKPLCIDYSHPKALLARDSRYRQIHFFLNLLTFF